MAYKIVKIPVSHAFTDRFKDGEDDTDFHAKSYPELDDYLSVMETRGWSIFDITYADQQLCLYITLHQPDSVTLGDSTST